MSDDGLSACELDVLRLVAGGRSNREAGERLGLTGHTAKGYLRGMARKFDVLDRTVAAVLALQRGLIDIEGISLAKQDCPLAVLPHEKILHFCPSTHRPAFRLILR